MRSSKAKVETCSDPVSDWQASGYRLLMAQAFPPEFLLVAAGALAPDDELKHRATTLVQAGLDWEQVRLQAGYHSVLGMIGDRFARHAPGLVPDWLADAAREELTGNLALQTAQAHHTARIVEGLAQSDVRAIVLKGVPLARRVYPENPQWRFTGDIDLLIDFADLAVADKVLRAGGHRRTRPDEAMLAKLGPKLLARFAKDYDYTSADGAHHVEPWLRSCLRHGSRAGCRPVR